MNFWQMLTWSPNDQLVELAQIAEALGFTGVMLSDHALYPQQLNSSYPYSADGRPPLDETSPYPDIWVSLGAIAAATRTLRLSTAVYILPLRPPLDVAKAAATLAVLSNHRFALGAGLGWMGEEFEVYGVDFASRGRRFDESVTLLRSLWEPGFTSHEGEFFRIPPVQIGILPGRQIPIFAGGGSQAARRRAARLADGWIGNGNDPGEVPAVLAQLTELRRQAGRANHPFETIMPLNPMPSVDELQRLHELGLDGTVSYPLTMTGDPDSSIAQKHRQMEEFARQFILPLR